MNFGFGKFAFGKKSRFRKNLVSEKVSVLVTENLVSEKSLGFGKIWYRKKVSVLVTENMVSEKNPNNKNSARNEVPHLGLVPNWDQNPEMVPNKSQFCSYVQNFILVASQAKSHISLINCTVNNNKKNM